MIPTVDQLRFLNSLLSILSGDYKAELSNSLPQNVVTTFQLGHLDRRLECGITIDPSEEDDGKWTVNAVTTSGGSQWVQPDVDVVEIEGPSVWEGACAALVRAIVAEQIDNILLAEGEAKYAAECENDDFDWDRDFSHEDVDAVSAVDRDAADRASEAETHGDEY